MWFKETRNPPVFSHDPNEYAPDRQRSEDSQVYWAHSAPFGSPNSTDAALNYLRQIVARPSRKATSFGHIWHARPKAVPADSLIAQSTASYLRSAGRHDSLVLQAIMPSDIHFAFVTANDSLRNFARDRGKSEPLRTFSWRNGKFLQHPKINTSRGLFRAKHARINQATLVAASMVDLGDVRAATRWISRAPEYTVEEMITRLGCGDLFAGADGERVMAQAIYRLTRRYISASSKPVVGLYRAAVLAASAYLENDESVVDLATTPEMMSPERVRMDHNAFNRSLNTVNNDALRAANRLAHRLATRTTKVFDARSVQRKPREAAKLLLQLRNGAPIATLEDAEVSLVRGLMTDAQLLHRMHNGDLAATQDEADDAFDRGALKDKKIFEMQAASMSLAIVLAGAVHCCEKLKAGRDKKIQVIGQVLSVVFAGLGSVPFAGPALAVVGSIAAIGFDKFKETVDIKKSLKAFILEIKQTRDANRRRSEQLETQVSAARRSGVLATAPVFMALQEQSKEAKSLYEGLDNFAAFMDTALEVVDTL